MQLAKQSRIGYMQAGRRVCRPAVSLVSSRQQVLPVVRAAADDEEIDWTEDLPTPVRRRVAALKEVQDKYDELHRQYLKELAEISAKYEQKAAPLYDQRTAIVEGKQEVGKYDLPDSQDKDEGIPEFWLTALTNHDLVGETISERDAEVLKHLTDIRVTTMTGEDSGSFKLTFTFAPNEHFKNATLEKTFLMEDMEEMVPRSFIGTPIEWADGKDTTKVVVKRRVQDKKLKGKAPAVTVNKTEDCESFFNFFRTPNMPENPEDLTDEELEALQTAMDEDFEIGLAIKEAIVPRAVLWFTGEAAPPYYDEDMDEGEFEEYGGEPTGRR